MVAPEDGWSNFITVGVVSVIDSHLLGKLWLVIFSVSFLILADDYDKSYHKAFYMFAFAL